MKGVRTLAATAEMIGVVRDGGGGMEKRMGEARIRSLAEIACA